MTDAGPQLFSLSAARAPPSPRLTSVVMGNACMGGSARECIGRLLGFPPRLGKKDDDDSCGTGSSWDPEEQDHSSRDHRGRPHTQHGQTRALLSTAPLFSHTRHQTSTSPLFSHVPPPYLPLPLPLPSLPSRRAGHVEDVTPEEAERRRQERLDAAARRAGNTERVRRGRRRQRSPGLGVLIPPPTSQALGVLIPLPFPSPPPPPPSLPLTRSVASRLARPRR